MCFLLGSMNHESGLHILQAILIILIMVGLGGVETYCRQPGSCDGIMNACKYHKSHWLGLVGFLKTAMVFGHIPLWFNDPKWGWVKIDFYPILTYVKKELLSRILKYVFLHSHWYEVTSMHWTPMRDAWTIWYLCSHQPMRAWALLWASHVLRFASNVLRPAGAKSSMTCWHMKIFAWAPILMAFERPGNESGRRTFGRSNRIKQTAYGYPVARCRCVWTSHLTKEKHQPSDGFDKKNSDKPNGTQGSEGLTIGGGQRPEISVSLQRSNEDLADQQFQ